MAAPARMGWVQRTAALLVSAGHAARNAGRYEPPAACFLRAADVEGRRGDARRAARALVNAAISTSDRLLASQRQELHDDQ